MTAVTEHAARDVFPNAYLSGGFSPPKLMGGGLRRAMLASKCGLTG